MKQRTLIAEIVIGVVVAVIAAAVIAYFGIDRPSHSIDDRSYSPPQETRQTVAELKTRPPAQEVAEKPAEAVRPSYNLIGSWQGTFLLNNVPVNDVYTFHTNGSWAEEVFNQLGQQIAEGEGTYRYVDGQVNIAFFSGGSEVGTLTWIDNNQFHYRIIDHTQPEQIGLEVYYKRLVR